MKSRIFHLLSVLLVTYIVPLVNSGPVTVVTKSDDFSIVILHNNDMHARFEQTGIYSNQCSPEDAVANKCYGGFARVSTLIKKYRAEAKSGGMPVLYLNAGDTYTGTPWFTLYKDEIVADFMNKLMPDAISLGNHEFDLGVNGLIPFLNKAHFPVLAANVDTSKIPELSATTALKKSHVFDIQGTRIGVIGYLTPETKVLAPPNDVDFADEIESINAEAKILKDSGVKIILALGHSGFDVDKLIGQRCPDIDVVIGGHSNTFLNSGSELDIEKPEGPYPFVVSQSNGKRVPVVQAYAYTKYLGHLKLTFDSNGNLQTFDGEPMLLNNKIDRDPEVLQLLSKYRPGIEAMQREVVATSKVFLDGSCRMKECNLGNMIADSMVFAYAKRYNGDYWTDASIGFVQGGGIRAAAPKGEITQYDLTTILPFDNQLYSISVTGQEIKDALERSVERYTKTIANGEFLQMSGIHVVYNMSRPSGNRVDSVSVQCSQCSVPRYSGLVLTDTYNIVISQFLNSGGDGFNMFLKPGTSIELTDLEALAEYVKHLNVLYPAVEWRITMNGEAPDAQEPPAPTVNPNDPDDGSSAVTLSIPFVLIICSLLIQWYKHY